MFYNNCSGCLQVPVPVQYWSPYLAPAKKSSFHIADILRQHMTNSATMSQVCQNVPRKRSDIKRVHLSELSKRSEFKRLIEPENLTNDSKRHKHSPVPVSENNKRLKHREASTCSQPSALVPLQALCSVGVQCFNEGVRGLEKKTDTPRNLKFGINRILSEDFGKEKTEKENNPENECCDCSEYRQVTYPTYALSAVHALQPPRYPPSPPDADTLPGPYSVLNTDVNGGSHNKRKRSWSRAVFSNLQRKGLEKRFEVQKYVTKPDRRQLAAMLGLTDAQVKVWFQNRRMKWRHSNQQQQTESDKDTSKEDDDMDDVDSKNIDGEKTEKSTNSTTH